MNADTDAVAGLATSLAAAVREERWSDAAALSLAVSAAMGAGAKVTVLREEAAVYATLALVDATREQKRTREVVDPTAIPFRKIGTILGLDLLVVTDDVARARRAEALLIAMSGGGR